VLAAVSAAGVALHLASGSAIQGSSQQAAAPRGKAASASSEGDPRRAATSRSEASAHGPTSEDDEREATPFEEEVVEATGASVVDANTPEPRPAGATIRARVRLPEGIEDVRVLAVLGRPGRMPRIHMELGPDGAFERMGLDGGSWVLRVHCVDEWRFERGVELAPGSVVELGDIDLRGEIHPLVVDVVDENGAPMDALVTPVDVEGTDPGELETGADGRAVFASDGAPHSVRVWADGFRAVVATDLIEYGKVTLPPGIPVTFRLPRDLPALAEGQRLTLLVFEEALWTSGLGCGPEQVTEHLMLERSGKPAPGDLWTLRLPGPGRYMCGFRVGVWHSKTPKTAFELTETGQPPIIDTELDTASLLEALRAPPRAR
jgi:hypothetical protein